MNRVIGALFVIFTMLLSEICIVYCLDDSSRHLLIDTSAKALESANKDLIEIYDITFDEDTGTRIDMVNPETWYFKNIASAGALQTAYIDNAISRAKENGKGLSSERYWFVYGIGSGDVKYWGGQRQQRYLGYNRDGHTFDNPDFPWDDWSGTQIQDYEGFIVRPWNNREVCNKYNIGNNSFNSSDPLFKSKLSSKAQIDDLEKNIQLGMNIFYGDATGKDVVSGKYQTNKVYTKNSKPKFPDGTEGKWVDFVQIIQPPTYYSWGTGWIFRNTDSDEEPEYYMTVPIAPFELVNGFNLETFFTESPSTVPEGRNVTVKAMVLSSNNKETVVTNAKWEVYGNNPYRLIKTEEIKELDIVEGRRISVLTLNVPRGGVKVKFSVNYEDPHNPEETSPLGYTDNVAEININALEPSNAHALCVLDYDMLSRKVRMGLGPDGAEKTLTARLELPTSYSSNVYYDWDSNTNTTGYLNIINRNTNVFSMDTPVIGSGTINESATVISRTPIITGIVERKFFGDLPGESWLPNGNDPIAGAADITYEGEISRNYIRYVWVEDIDGGGEWERSGGGTRTAYFQSGKQTLDITVKVYHGEDQPVSARGPVYDVNGSPRYKYNYGLSDHSEFSAGEQSTADDPTNQTKKFAWEGRRYLDIPVLRYMYHAGVDGNPEGDYEPILGKLPRKFQHKDTAEVKYEILTSYKDHFEPDRQLAEDGKTKRFENAPFATDLSAWQGHDGDRDYFPLKAGYYYRPYAQYKATVKTVSYLRAGEKSEHAAIVEKVKDSFWAQTTLSHSDENGNEISVPYEIDRNVAYRTDLVKRERLLYSPDRVEDDVKEPTGTNGLYKRLLEGWDSSATGDSFTNYKYREYVKPLEDKEIYRIEEVTEITFTVNPHGDKFYTHPNLRDNDYTINAGFAEFTQSFNNGEEDNEVKVSRIEGPDNDGLIDTITFTIFDSMFDDVYNESR